MLKWLFPVNWLLVFFPIALAIHFTQDAATAGQWVFVSAALAIVPLAGFMGESTEHLAERTGPGIGGLLNASFGNAAELIIAFVVLRAGHIDIVQASIAGSIIGNVLFVFGLAALCGGLKYEKQRFNATAAGLGASMLFLATIGLMIPTIFVIAETEAHEDPARVDQLVLHMSYGIAGVLLFTYFLKLIFSLRTHAHLYAGEVWEMERAASGLSAEPAERDTHEHRQPWSVKKAVFLLVLATALVAYLSEILVHAIEPAVASFGLSEIFVGMVVLAIVGNAAEHGAAVMMAMRNRMNLSITICVESSKQIALFVTPVLVFAGLLIGQPMTLHFSLIEVAAIFFSVTALAMLCHDGETNWMEGVHLLAVYAILCFALYFFPDAGAASHAAEGAAAGAAAGP